MQVYQAVDVQAGREVKVKSSAKARSVISAIYDHGDGDIEIAVEKRYRYSDVSLVEAPGAPAASPRSE